jgi:hypothetical protein
VDTDKLGIANLVVAAIGTVAGVVAALAAIRAVKYGKHSPTKEDLARVERNTGETAERLHRVDERLNQQHIQDLLISKAWKVSIEVNGVGLAEEPMNLKLDLRTPGVELVSVEMLNEAQMHFGRCDCIPLEPQSFTCVAEPGMVRRWFNGGRRDAQHNRRLLQLRAHMRMADGEAYRDFAVHITERFRPVAGQGQLAEFAVDGNC